MICVLLIVGLTTGVVVVLFAGVAAVSLAYIGARWQVAYLQHRNPGELLLAGLLAGIPMGMVNFHFAKRFVQRIGCVRGFDPIVTDRENGV
jgi:hypothetical protein